MPLALALALAVAPQGTVSIANTALAIDGEMFAGDGFLAFAIAEHDQGLDLNGDGDLFDRAPAVRDLATGATQPIGVAGQIRAISGGRLLLAVPEFSQGGLDLNGDGDVNDEVAMVYDATTGVLTSLGLALYAVDVEGDLAAMAVHELGQGFADLNGDGDADDQVLFAVDLAGPTVWNLGLDAISYAVGPDGVAFFVRESAQGGADLNGDGDAIDRVLHLWDRASGAIQATTLAVSPSWLEAHGGGRYSFRASEDANAGADLNGDGDSDDHVLHFATFGGGAPTNIGLPAGVMAASEHLAVFSASEAAQGATDLNGDGDALDDVLLVLDVATGLVSSTGLPITFSPGPRVSGRRVTFGVSEADHGATDLNGDGDAVDNVLHHHDAVTGLTSNLGFAIGGNDLDGGLALFAVPEWSQGIDLNGDGDQSETVALVHDTASGTTYSTASSAWQTAVSGSVAHWLTWESSQGQTDLNGDGDTDDRVASVFEPSTGQTIDTGLAVFGTPSVAWGRWLAVSVDENAQGGTDLNGDGDFGDQVLHVVTLPLAHGLATDADFIDVSAGGAQRLALAAGVAHAGEVYVVAGSASGTTPGVILDGSLVPLVPDFYMALSLTAPNSAPFAQFVGVLDALGRSDAPAIVLPPASSPALVGLAVHHAFVTIGGTAAPVVSFASDARRTTLAP